MHQSPFEGIEGDVGITIKDHGRLHWALPLDHALVRLVALLGWSRADLPPAPPPKQLLIDWLSVYLHDSLSETVMTYARSSPAFIGVELPVACDANLILASATYFTGERTLPEGAVADAVLENAIDDAMSEITAGIDRCIKKSPYNLLTIGERRGVYFLVDHGDIRLHQWESEHIDPYTNAYRYEPFTSENPPHDTSFS